MRSIVLYFILTIQTVRRVHKHAEKLVGKQHRQALRSVTTVVRNVHKNAHKKLDAELETGMVCSLEGMIVLDNDRSHEMY